MRKGWTEEDEQQLKEEFGRSESLRLIAEKHRRTIRAIEARLERLGLFFDNRGADNKRQILRLVR